MVNKKENDQRELWLKIKISRVQLYLIIFLIIVTGVITFLIYFDKIGVVLEWKASKLEEQIESKIANLSKVGAEPEEIEAFQATQNSLFNTRKSLSILKYLDKLNTLNANLDEFIGKLKEYQRGYVAQVAKVVKIVDVNSSRGLNWDRAKKGMKLDSGDKVRTGNESLAEIRTDSGNMLRINPESLIIIKDIGRDRKTFRPREIYSIRESPDAEYQVRTKGSDMVFQDNSAEFNVAQNSTVRIRKRQQKATISVFKGHVQVKNDRGETKELKTRDVLSIDSDGIFKDAYQIPYPPELQEPFNLNFFRFKGPEEVNVLLRWSPYKDVSWYRLQVSKNIDFSKIIVDTEVSGVQYRVKNLQNGNYFWRVASIIKKGKDMVISEFSVARSFLITFQGGGDRTDITPPTFESLQIKALSRTTILVEGKTEPGARLMIEQKSIDIKEDGTFSDLISLGIPGKRMVTVELSDSAGNVTRKRISVY